MWSLGPLAFAAPLALAALAALPVAAWLLRALPPLPRRTLFPPLRLLLGVRAEQETPRRTPWWLVALRLAVLALVILAAARPILSPEQAASGRSAALVLAVDDGWAAAQDWARLTAAAEAPLARAEAARAEVRLIFTAPDPAGRVGTLRLDAAAARARLRGHTPRPWSVDRAAAAAALARVAPPGGGARVLWLSDGVDDPGAGWLAAALARFGPLETVRAAPARAVLDVRADSAGLAVAHAALPGAPGRRALVLEDEAGAVLLRAEHRLPSGAVRVRTVLAADRALLNRAAVLRLEGVEGAGAAHVLAAAARRPAVGVVGDPFGRAGALAAGGFYVVRALQADADVEEAPLPALLARRPDALVLPGGPLAGADVDAATAYVEAGGVLVRFADARLLAGPDALVPAPLAERPRALDGALTWTRPQGLAPAASGPLAGLTPPADARVRRLAAFREGVAPAGVAVWASLADGSPLVSAARRGQGWVVLVHVAATPGGSDLPLTGAFVDLLARLSRLGLPQETAASTAGPWTPVRLLDGFSRWREPGADDAPAARLDGAASPGRPPGVYAAAGGRRAALNALTPASRLVPLPTYGRPPAEVEAPERPLGGPLLLLALALLIADALAAGRLLRPPAVPAAAAALLLTLAPAAPAAAQDAASLAAETRLAYVVTGDPTVDGASREGLEALTQVLRARTAVAPGAPVGVDPARVQLAPYPCLYWPVTVGAPAPSAAAAARLAQYLRGGGVILFDTLGAPPEAAATALRRVTAPLDPPPLRVVGSDHVLAKSFYLLGSFPGRVEATRLWAATTAGESVDGVSPVLMGGGDWAAAWAGRPGVGPQQRELALRFGVNWTLYALTGTYKADQVHVPALLERLERGRPR